MPFIDERFIIFEAENVTNAVLTKSFKDNPNFSTEDKQAKLAEMISAVQEQVIKAIDIPRLQTELEAKLQTHFSIPDHVPYGGIQGKDPGDDAEEKIHALETQIRELFEKYKCVSSFFHRLTISLMNS